MNSAGMRVTFNVVLPNFGYGSGRESIVKVATAAEELGYAGVGPADHVLVPHGEPERYERVFEAFTTLAYIAALTERIKLIPSIIVLPMRNPFLVAKVAATLDVLSGGRLILGLGV